MVLRDVTLVEEPPSAVASGASWYATADRRLAVETWWGDARSEVLILG